MALIGLSAIRLGLMSSALIGLRIPGTPLGETDMVAYSAGTPLSSGLFEMPAGSTYDRASSGVVTDYALTLRTISSGTPRMSGARYDGNTPYWKLSDGTALHPTRKIDGQLIFDSYPIWQATTAYSLGAKRIPATWTYPAGGDGYWYEVTTAGTSGGTEPTWAAGSFSDGTVTWTRGGYYRVAGYLHEQQSTNILLRSQELEAAAWTQTALASVTANATVAPDGTTTAELITENTATGGHHISQLPSGVGNNTNYVISVYVKAATRTWCSLTSRTKSNSTRDCYFNLANGTVGTVSGGLTNPRIMNAGNGWWRCQVTTNSLSGATAFATYFMLATGDGGKFYTGDGTSGLYFWNPQCEEVDASATSAIATTTGAVTRSADTLVLPAAAVSDTAGMLVVDVASLAWQFADGSIIGNGSEYLLRQGGTITALLLHCDGADGSTTFTDVTGKTITVSGTSHIETDQSKFGGASAYFATPSGGYISAPNHTDFGFGSSDFTIEGWLYSAGGVSEQIMRRALTTGFAPYYLSIAADGTLSAQFSITGSAWDVSIASNAAVNNSTWHHFAVVRDGATFRMYIDGVEQTSTATNANPLMTSSAATYIGARSDTGAVFTGYLDDLKITKYTALYRGNFTPSSIALLPSNSGGLASDGVNLASGPAVSATSGWMRIAMRWNAATGKMQIATNGVAGIEQTYDGSFNLSALNVGYGLSSWIRNLRLYAADEGTTKITTLSALETS